MFEDHKLREPAANVVGATAAALMDSLGRNMPPEATISALAIVACVHVGPGVEQGDSAYKVYVKSNDGRAWVQIALLEQGIISIHQSQAEAQAGPPPRPPDAGPPAGWEPDGWEEGADGGR